MMKANLTIFMAVNTTKLIKYLYMCSEVPILWKIVYLKSCK